MEHVLSTVLIASIAVVVVVVENRARKAFSEPVHFRVTPERRLHKGGRHVTRFTSVRPQYYPTALLAITERPRTEQWMDPKGRERYMIYSRRQREF